MTTVGIPSHTIWCLTEASLFLADCQARLAFDLIANTWSAVVVWALRHGPRRPGRLREEIGGISPKVLTETLRRLEFNGLVARRAYAEAPPRVEYELTELGRSLLGPIEAFGVWASDHADEVMAAQDLQSSDHFL
ncbi:winged helix-turn-helix transcriptional regulator [Nonomuraea diastatica]|uniref:Transcriptional regulator n=1 Tax=Nonomuraea diastatica TaxID=1848329 RepID=A0A4R4WQM3_9ACTN|nr:helix-turn-helix domain-containing protein [Nonomuraea diastatica]TDD17120.1 transcriptional regulator [Nonomuraea diastatica]